jgi:hypothetical protein
MEAITMKISRRSLLFTSAAGAGINYLRLPAHAQPRDEPTPPLPKPELFESGDFLWPKLPGAIVPYNSEGITDPEQQRQQWEAERDRYIDEVKRGKPSSLTPAEIDAIKSLAYSEFYARYAGDQKPNMPGVYSDSSGLYVGHVGVIEIDASGTRWVIEAVMTKGVIRQTYDKWLVSRPGQVVWLGRLKGIEKDKRNAVALEAKKYVGRPYNFWNFDLNDDKDFYCSKLVWLSVFRALHMPVDRKEIPKRGFWFSPKQLLSTDTIARIHNPGKY